MDCLNCGGETKFVGILVVDHMDNDAITSRPQYCDKCVRGFVAKDDTFTLLEDYKTDDKEKEKEINIIKNY